MLVIVSRKSKETEDIVRFELVNAEGGSLPSFTAGAHIDVELPGGMTRQYSLCNPPDENHRYVLGVLKDPESRGGSKALHETVSEGDRLMISTPKNHFPLVESAPSSLLLAGGIGVTPIICMAERLFALGRDFEMHYFTRAPERTAFWTQLRKAPFANKVKHYFDDGMPEHHIDLKALLCGSNSEANLYVCGPKGFIDAVLSTARDIGWSEDRLNYEFFAAEVTQQDGDEAFEVELAQTGRVVKVDKGQTVIGALEAEGIEVLVSCEQGVCGTCLTKVLDGIPDHRDVYLTPTEQAANDQFLPCCSRSKTSRLVLDL